MLLTALLPVDIALSLLLLPVNNIHPLVSIVNCEPTRSLMRGITGPDLA